MTRSVAAALLVVLGAALGACGSQGGGAVEGGAGQAEPAPVTTTQPPAGSAATVSRQLCTFLTDETSRLEDRSSAVAALAGFARDYSGWLREDLDRAAAITTDLDSIARTSCPKVRSRLLEVLNRDSLAKTVGR